MTASIARAHAAYCAVFGEPPERIAYAPGRVNLIGEHTDYNDGFVLPCAIDRGTAIAIGPGSEPGLTIWSADYAGFDRVSAAAAFEADTDHSWRTHVRAVAAALRAWGAPLGKARLAIAGDVPQGAGLSSSASLGVALAAALAPADRFNPTELAQIAQAAENDYVGCACGIMDQLIAARGEAGAALLIDCRSLDARAVPIPEPMAILIVHSGISRGLVDSAYNERRAACEAVAGQFGMAALRDLNLATLNAGQAQLDPVQFRRARHVVTENARTLAMPDAIAAGDWASISALMAQSHASMRDDFEITLPEIDALVIALDGACNGIGGARMTGGGFGGCVVALTREDRIPALREAACAHFIAAGRPAGLIHACRPSAGMTISSPDSAAHTTR